MSFILKVVAGLTAAFALVATSAAGEYGTKVEAVALAQKAIAHYKANGKDKSFAEVSNKAGAFIDRDLYVYVFDQNALMMAHGTNDKLVGKNLMQLKDADGKLFVQDLVAVMKSGKGGWVDYKWPNPVTKQIEQKTTYIEPVGEYGFAVGVYK